jgi:serine/threonine protein kinase
VARALGLAVQLGEALEAAHNAGIVHGNLTASQVVIGGDPEEARLAGLECGRLPIPAPGDRTERDARPQSSERGEASEQANIRAFGAILFEMLAGAPPPAAGGAPSALNRRRHGVPRRVSELVGRMLAAGPGAPPIDISQVLNELWSELHRLGPEAGAGRARVWRIAAAGALALLVVGAAWLLVQRSVATPPARAAAPVAPLPPAAAAPRPGPTGGPPGPAPTAPPPGHEAAGGTTATPALAAPGAPGAVESAPPAAAPQRGEVGTPTPAPPPPVAEARPAPLPEPPAARPPRSRPPPAAAGVAPAAAPERPPARPGAETHDDGAIIDWLLKDASR